MIFLIINILFFITFVKAYTNNLLLNELQVQYKESLENFQLPIVLCTGPAGTGKTMIACNEAINSLKSKKINKIIITRPTITVEENI